MELKDKTIVFLGSSVTYGCDGWSMCEFINETTGADVVKWALSGTTLADISKDSYVSRLNANIDSQKACDCFICQLSTNDAAAWNKLPLGEISISKNKEDFDTSTIIGAIEYIVASAKEKWNCPIAFYTGVFFENELYQKMVDALTLLSKKWGFGIIDLWNNPEMRAISEDKHKEYMGDEIHPTKLGYTEWWGPKFIEYLNSVL